MKRKILLLALAIPLALSAAIRYAQKPLILTVEDCALIFPETNSCEKMRALETGELFGEAWANGVESADEFLGYVFLKPITHEGKMFDLLVGVNKSGVIAGIKVKGVDDVPEEFLAQFHGKTGQYDFAVACTPDDIMYVPLKIKAMRGNIPLSESIAQGVKAIAVLAPATIKK
jgi:hypothetical protein